MAHCWDQRDEGQVGEVGETRALHQGNLSPRLDTDPSCRGRVSSLAQVACRIRSFVRSLEPYWTKHAGSNCSHCWAPLHWGQPQPPHCPHSDGFGSLTVSPWLLSHSQEVILATVTVLTLTDAHMPPPMLRLAGCRLGSSDTGVRPVRGGAPHQRTTGGRAVSGAAGRRRRIGRNQLGGRELGPAVSQASRSSHLLLLLLPRAVEAKPPDARPRDLVLGLDQQPKSVNTHPSISGSWELFMLWSDLKSMSPDWYGWAIQAGC